MTWACLRVQLRQERKVAEYLREIGVLAYCPIEVRKVEVKTLIVRRFVGNQERTRIVPKTYALIPGYVFAYLPDNHAIDLARSVRTVIEIMARDGKPRPVELERLRGLFIAEMFRRFDATYKPPKVKGHTPRWKAGDAVKGQGGHVEGWMGTVLAARGRQQVEVMFVMFGREIPVLVDEADLTHAPDIALKTAA